MLAIMAKWLENDMKAAQTESERVNARTKIRDFELWRDKCAQARKESMVVFQRGKWYKAGRGEGALVTRLIAQHESEI